MGDKRMTREEKDKCQFCLNCDIDGYCIAKQESPFNSFVCEHNEMFEPYTNEIEDRR